MKLEKLCSKELQTIYGGRLSEEKTHKSYTTNSENENGCTDEKVTTYEDYSGSSYEALESEIICWTCD